MFNETSVAKKVSESFCIDSDHQAVGPRDVNPSLQACWKCHTPRPKVKSFWTGWKQRATLWIASKVPGIDYIGGILECFSIIFLSKENLRQDKGNSNPIHICHSQLLEKFINFSPCHYCPVISLLLPPSQMPWRRFWPSETIWQQGSSFAPILCWSQRNPNAWRQWLRCRQRLQCTGISWLACPCWGQQLQQRRCWTVVLVTQSKQRSFRVITVLSTRLWLLCWTRVQILAWRRSSDLAFAIASFVKVKGLEFWFGVCKAAVFWVGTLG